MAREQITQSKYFSLLGLVTLAQEHEQAMRELELAALKITGESSVGIGDGFTGAAIYGLGPGGGGPRSVADDLLDKLGITVKDEG